ncbi:hypothetical protein V5O48_014664 [Marasmius crinis-equi]|uniref:Uncharacterized protein n=1 Tax=Marasmius crinis-equi TaxID=585013 RepID=A0ABR3EWN8_9AGAR
MAIFQRILSYLSRSLAKMSQLTTHQQSPFHDEQLFIYTVNRVTGLNGHASFSLKDLDCELRIADDRCKVRSIAFCKRLRASEHESIVALISFPPSSRAPDAPRLERPIIIERGFPRDPNFLDSAHHSLDAVMASSASSTKSSTGLSRPPETPESASKSRIAADTITVPYTTRTQWDLASLVHAAAKSQVDPVPDPSFNNQSESATPPMPRQHSFIYALEYEEEQCPTLVDLVVIASMVSENRPYYKALEENCYYFAAMVFGVVEKVFPVDRVKNVEPSGQPTGSELYRGLTLPVGRYAYGTPSSAPSGRFQLNDAITLRTLNTDNTHFREAAQKLSGQFPNRRNERVRELEGNAQRAEMTREEEMQRLVAKNKRLEEQNAAKDLRIAELEHQHRAAARR